MSQMSKSLSRNAGREPVVDSEWSRRTVLGLALYSVVFGTGVVSGPGSWTLAFAGDGDGGDGDGGDGDGGDGDGEGGGGAGGAGGAGSGAGAGGGGSSGGGSAGGGGSSGGGGSGGGGDGGGGGDSSDSLRVQIAKGRRNGHIRPYSQLRRNAIGRTGGRLVGARAVKRRGQIIYRFRIVDRRSRLVDVYINARSGKIVRIRGR